MPTPDTIPRVLADTASRRGDHPAVVSGSGIITWSELLESSRAFGAALIDAGVEPGDRVAIWAGNGPEWVIAVHGLVAAGATLVPVNTRFKGAEAAVILSRARCRVLVTATDFLGVNYVEMLRSDGTALPDLKTIVTVGPPVGEATPWTEFLRWGSNAAQTIAQRSAAVSPDDPSDILFTSGTTGVPKGVVMTHARTLSVARDWVDMAGLTADDRYLMINPYFHMFGLKAGILASSVAGATMLPEPNLDVERLLRRVQEERVTVLPGPPTLYQSILDHPDRDRFDLSSLRVAVTGSAEIPVELIRRVYQELPFRLVVSGYGLTEGGTASGTGPHDDFEAIATTVGHPRPGFEIRIADDHGDERPAGEAGEVWLRGPSVMAGYLDDPEATAAAITEEGWLRTGDLGMIDADGRLRIVGRLKDMFIVGGFNAYPAEIENLLLRHPALSQAAVIGVPDERLGEVGMAFVVPIAGAQVSEEEVVAWSRANMANYKAPRYVRVVESLPLGATGKVQKEALRAQAAGLINRR